MILIISQPNDYSTDEVVKWLNFYNYSFLRINYTDSVSIKNFVLNKKGFNIEFVFNNKVIQYKDITGVYYRRGMLNVHPATTSNISKNNSLNRLIVDEVERLQEFLHEMLEHGNSVGSFNNRSLNKLRVLKIAQKFGLDIPETNIVNDKKSVNKLIQENKLITKNISEVAYILDRDMSFNSLTYAVDKQLIDDSSEQFLYSLFQTNIKKEFEIRSFYLRGRFYSSAMFTQLNSKTNTDFRNYDDDKPTRIVPFQLPEEIENKLRKVFDELDLNTGSIDMIYSNGRYYFLEINPVGQYGMIGEPCNYYLERELVESLIVCKKIE